MKISIITVTLNNGKFLQGTIDSVMGQYHKDIEYIIVDGGSNDGSDTIIQNAIAEYGNTIKYYSLPANGVYNAINFGIKKATGDVIGLLHGNDKFAAIDILTLVDIALQDNSRMAVFGDVYYVKPSSGKRIRTYSAKGFTPDKLRCLFAPPHPSLFLRRNVYENFGVYKENYITAADFEYIVRILGKENVKYKYIPVEMVEMTVGGMSTTFYNRLFTNPKEKIRGLRENGFKVSWTGVIGRYISLLFSLIKF